jgi:hypothetical protein
MKTARLSKDKSCIMKQSCVNTALSYHKTTFFRITELVEFNGFLYDLLKRAL